MDVLVPSDSVRKIVVGKRGAGVEAVTARAEHELAAMWGVPVRLVLQIKTQRR